MIRAADDKEVTMHAPPHMARTVSVEQPEPSKLAPIPPNTSPASPKVLTMAKAFDRSCSVVISAVIACGTLKRSVDDSAQPPKAKLSVKTSVQRDKPTNDTPINPIPPTIAGNFPKRSVITASGCAANTLVAAIPP